MVIAEGLKHRLNRLRGGEFRHEDIRKLILYLRENAPRERVVNDVGNFVAHGKRIQGITFNKMRDVFTVAVFKLSNIENPFSLSSLPPNGLQAMQACRRLLSARDLKARTGMNAGAINRSLESLLSAYLYDMNGNANLTRPLTPEENKLGRELTSYIVSQPAFTQKDLFKDFCVAMTNAELLAKGEKLDEALFSPWLAITAIDAMHGSTLEWPHWRESPVVAGITEDRLGVMSSTEFTSKGAKLDAMFPIFTTDLKPEDCCTEPLSTVREGTYRCPVEVTADGKLNALLPSEVVG